MSALTADAPAELGNPYGLSDTATRVFSSIPPYFITDPLIRKLIAAIANELDRIEAFLISIQRGLVPTLADDTFHMLSIWEWVLGVPVAPAVPVEVRRQVIRACLLRRFCMRAIDWERAMSIMLGSSNWSHVEGVPGPGIITIRVPFTSDTYVGGFVKEFARSIVPANYQILFGYQSGFIVGVSHVGDAI